MPFRSWARRTVAAMSAIVGALCVVPCSLLLAQSMPAQTALPDNVAQTPRPPAPGESPALDSARAAMGAALTISIYTYGPGPAVFEKFGHIAIGIADARTGEDVAYNWGMFDFDQPNFLGRFLTGDTRYWMAGYRTFEFNTAYQAQDRTIRKQVLNLTPVQRGALYDLVAWNASEQNRYYRYDYYNDNCSTRVRDALDWVLRGALRPALDSTTGYRSWRGETARITAQNLPVYAGIQVALGRGADRHLTRWEEAFLPEYLAESLAAVPVEGVTLVQQDTVLYRAQAAPLDDHAPNRIMPALALGLALGVALFVLARVAPAVVTVTGVVWYAVGGVLGAALLLAGTITKHGPYMGKNLNLMALSPLLLFAAALWPWRGAVDRLGRAARALALLTAGIGLVGLVLMHVPGIWQQSMMVSMVVVPVHAALALIATRAPRDSGATT